MKRFVAFLAFIPIVPIICVVALVFWVYRIVLSWFLQCKHGDSFVGMLEGQDAMWGLEEDKNCGVVNIVAFVENSVVNGVEDLPQKLRKVFVNRFEKLISTKMHQFQKAFLKRNRAFGYFYWTNDLGINLSDHIRLLEPKSSKTYLSETELQKLASWITTANLPVKHGALWEMLISAKPMLNEHGTVHKFPIFLRFHHSMGDGVAMLRFIMEEIMNPTEMWTFSPKAQEKPKLIKTILIWLKAIYECPLQLIRTLQMKSDPNCLNGKVLTPNKVVTWQNEKSISTTCHWLPLIEKIQTNQLGVAYSSVFITALSGTLHKYFDARGEHPKQVTIAIPVRIKHQEPMLKLENAFTTPMVQLPIKPGVHLDDTGRHHKLINKLAAIKQATETLKSSTNILVNYLTVIILAATFPVPILEYLSKMFRITASVSVMAVLKETLKVGPYELKDLIFWPPTFGTVGLNFSVFVYGNQLQLSLLADRNVLPAVDDATELLQEVLREIERMDAVMGK
ncbi:uncharacterized protein LOC135711916 [Ochlerotatus camptorhynchus]|uniref:uncharacterized protein LOC135711916 n=1 Tax=Ochlerotatus camptorhynchus TaxID=644619 RepID=UPI0031E13ABE